MFRRFNVLCQSFQFKIYTVGSIAASHALQAPFMSCITRTVIKRCQSYGLVYLVLNFAVHLCETSTFCRLFTHGRLFHTFAAAELVQFSLSQSWLLHAESGITCRCRLHCLHSGGRIGPTISSNFSKLGPVAVCLLNCVSSPTHDRNGIRAGLSILAALCKMKYDSLSLPLHLPFNLK